MEPSRYLRLIALGALVGIPAALVAAVFLGFIHELQHWLWHDLPDALGHEHDVPWYLVLGLPVVGALLVIFARKAFPGDGGHNPVNGLNAAPTPPSAAVGVTLAAIGTLGFGAVLGPEAPIIALGSIAALSVSAFVKLSKEEGQMIGLAGSFSAISALFGGPIVAGVMMMEAALGRIPKVIAALLPGFVAAAVGYLIFIGFDDWGGLDTPGLEVPNLATYTVELPDLLIAIVVGVVTALVCGVIRAFAHRVDDGEKRFGLAGLLLGGAVAVGLIAIVADGLGANSQDILFSGQDSIPAVVAEDSFGILAVMIVAKALAYAISLGCGFRGGPVFPAIFLGVGLATIPVALFDVSATFAVAVGCAAGMAAQTKLVLTSMVFATILVGSAGTDTVPAAVLAAAAAYVVTVALDARQGPGPGEGATPGDQPGQASPAPA